jgi:GTP cyclohydrolase I
MKQNGILHKVTKDDLSLSEAEVLLNKLHAVASADTPLRDDAFELTDEEKIEAIAGHFREIMSILGLDTGDDGLKDTPHSVAKMYVKEIFSGLDPNNKPITRLSDNKYSYKKMLVEKNIPIYSTCERHFVPIIGTAHVAYLPKTKLIDSSDISRIVQYYSHRPQVQEGLTMQIANELSSVLGTEDVTVIVDAVHLCVS